MDINIVLNQCHSYIDNILMPIVQSCKERLEGHIFDDAPHGPNIFLPKRQNIILASQNSKNALEIGFNSGFSALLILIANPTIKLTCVDIGHHRYTIPCFQQLKKDFGDRIELLIGDSREVVPTINDTFDLVHIDGGHSLNVAEKDITNTYNLLNNNAIIVMDDVNINDNRHTLANLWNKYVQIYNYTEPNFFIYRNDHQDVKCFSR
jgi:predicted O-methyltransferase YrrM